MGLRDGLRNGETGIATRRLSNEGWRGSGFRVWLRDIGEPMLQQLHQSRQLAVECEHYILHTQLKVPPFHLNELVRNRQRGVDLAPTPTTEELLDSPTTAPILIARVLRRAGDGGHALPIAVRVRSLVRGGGAGAAPGSTRGVPTMMVEPERRHRRARTQDGEEFLERLFW